MIKKSLTLTVNAKNSIRLISIMDYLGSYPTDVNIVRIRTTTRHLQVYRTLSLLAGFSECSH